MSLLSLFPLCTHPFETVRSVDRKIRQVDAARTLKMTRRNVQRLVNKYREHGPEGLVSKKRGMPSNNRYGDEFRENTVTIIGENYHDFGPTFAGEKLKENHGISLANETVRQWMIVAGLWIPKQQKRRAVKQPRQRRDCLGELVQIDGSQHDWFEGHAPKCTLLVFIDDATSKLLHLYFCESESTVSYMTATQDYLAKHGKPEALYSDKHGVFRVNHPSAKPAALTQYGRALDDLQITLICADSPEAKGRVERVNQTLQDRLIKEMRLAGIRSIESANQWLPEYIEIHNRKFSKPPRVNIDVHRTVRESQEELHDIFSVQDTRILSKSLSVQYERDLYLIDPSPATDRLMGKSVIVHRYLDNSLAMKYCGRTLPCKIFSKQEKIQQGTIVTNKRLGAVLDYARQVRENADSLVPMEAPEFWETGSTSEGINPLVMRDACEIAERPTSPPSG